MSKRETKKDHILCCGIDVMKTHGYNGTSVKDIVDAASVPKGSFYNYFESKEAFAVEALEKVADESLTASQAILENTGVTPLERLQNFFSGGANDACDADFKVGCFIGNIGQEMSDNNETIRNKVRQILKRNTLLISSVLEEAKHQGQLAPEADTTLMAEFIFNAWEGALMRMKASRCRASLEAFLEMLPHIIR